MNEFIRMADGTVIQNSYVVKLDEHNIAVYVKGEFQFQEVYGIFGDPNKTSSIFSNQYGDKYTWTGFTTVIAITLMEGRVCINLRKE